MYKCPYRDCSFRDSDPDEVDEHVVAAHREDPIGDQ